MQAYLTPPCLGNLTNLKELFLDHNKLKSIPNSMSHLRMLVRLDLSFNEIEELPSCIGSIISLYYLEIEGNKLLTKLPASLCGCRRFIVDVAALDFNFLTRRISKVERTRPKFQPVTLLNQCLAYASNWVQQ